MLWREDSSNISTKYLRNKLRHEVVPILKDINPQLLDSFKSTLSHLNDVADIVDESLNAVAKRAIVDMDETGISYKISEFKKSTIRMPTSIICSRILDLQLGTIF